MITKAPDSTPWKPGRCWLTDLGCFPTPPLPFSGFPLKITEWKRRHSYNLKTHCICQIKQITFIKKETRRIAETLHINYKNKAKKRTLGHQCEHLEESPQRDQTHIHLRIVSHPRRRRRRRRLGRAACPPRWGGSTGPPQPRGRTWATDSQVIDRHGRTWLCLLDDGWIK